MDKASEKIDPIRDRYYRPLETAEHALDYLFYISAALSLIAPLIDKRIYPVGYDWVQIAFVTVVLGAIALVASYIPTSRVIRTDPMLALAHTA